mgnify:CR=1 FL=1
MAARTTWTRGVRLLLLGVIAGLVLAPQALAEQTLDVSAHTTFDRTYTWDVQKRASHTEVTLSPGQTLVETYSVTVTNTGYVDSNWTASDGISLRSDTTFTATSVAAELTGGISAPIDCTFFGTYTPPFTGRSMACRWGPVALPDGSPRTVTATVGFLDGSSISNSYAFDFTSDLLPGQPVEYDKCVTVNDTYAGDLGTVCVGDAPKTFTYTRQIGPFEECGDVTIENTATIAGDRGRVLDSSDADLVVHVPCAGGCTLTQGYWKTHSREGPAPYDEAWKNLGPLEEDTPFFSSGMTWYQVFWTPPAGGNAWIQLAHQYMAAKLNILDGASTTPAVNSAITYAESFFATYKTSSTSLSKTAAKAARERASLLDAYNNGLIGPGHCDE